MHQPNAVGCCRYAWAAISEWQCQQGVTQQGMLGSEVVLSGPPTLRRSHSMSCMTQLQAKHAGTAFDQSEPASRFAHTSYLCIDPSMLAQHFTNLSLPPGVPTPHICALLQAGWHRF